MNRRDFSKATASLLLTSSLARAEGKPFQIIVPFGPGGSGDISARLIAEYLTKQTGRAAVVDNRPGANGILGVQAARAAPADGSVLVIATTSTHLSNPALYRQLPYDPDRDLRTVGSLGLGSTYILVRPDAPYTTVRQFVDAAKTAPGTMNYGHFNGLSNVAGALFAREANIDLTPVPYKQVAQALTELIAGRIHVIFTDTIAGDAMVASGQLRAIAVHSQTRLKKYPALPLLTETYPNYALSGGYLAIAVSAATPLPAQQQLNSLINAAIVSEPIKSKLESYAFVAKPMTLSEIATFERRERERWRTYVEIAKLEVQ